MGGTELRIAALIAAFALAGCAGTTSEYADRPVSQWPSQQVLESLPDD